MAGEFGGKVEALFPDEHLPFADIVFLAPLRARITENRIDDSFFSTSRRPAHPDILHPTPPSVA